MAVDDDSLAYLVDLAVKRDDPDRAVKSLLLES